MEKSLADDEREAIDKLETQIGMRRRGDLDEKLFAETRLRMGVYGQRYELAIGAFPSKRIPDVVDRLTKLWLAEREGSERLQPFIHRFGRAKVKKALDEFRAVPSYEDDPSFYRDWADAREYTIGDMGVGECAGEVVSFAEFGLADSERELFEAQLRIEAGDPPSAAQLAYRAMLSAARALVRIENIDVPQQRRLDR